MSEAFSDRVHVSIEGRPDGLDQYAGGMRETC